MENYKNVVIWSIAHLTFCRIEYFDDMATTAEGSSVDTWEPVAISQKNLHIEGVQIFFDELNTKRGGMRERTESTASSQVSLPANLPSF